MLSRHNGNDAGKKDKFDEGKAGTLFPVFHHAWLVNRILHFEAIREYLQQCAIDVGLLKKSFEFPPSFVYGGIQFF